MTCYLAMIKKFDTTSIDKFVHEKEKHVTLDDGPVRSVYTRIVNKKVDVFINLDMPCW